MADDKFIMFGLDDERSKDLADVLGNKTCKKILDHLADTKEASEKDLADALSIPINTVEYNLNKLIKSGLVEKTKNFFWSTKGKKIDMYKLSKKHIIISPKSKKPNMDILKTIIPVILVIAFIGVLIIGFNLNKFSDQTHNVNSTSDSGLKNFASYDELVNYINSTQGNSNFNTGVYRFAGGANIAPGAAPAPMMGAAKSADVSSSAGGSAESFSHTNNQVEGVDEADIVKNDGKYIYDVNSNRILIINAYPADSMNVVANISVDSPQNIFVNGDKLIVFSSSTNYVPYKMAPGVTCFSYGCGGSYLQKTNVYIYDIKDKSNPALVQNFSFDGNYQESRMIGDYVYLISNSYPNYNYPRPPVYSVNGVEKTISLTDIYYYDQYDSSYSFDTVSAIKIDSGDLTTKSYLMGSSYGTIYVSENNIYLTYQKQMSYSDYFNKLVDDVYLKVVPTQMKSKIQDITNSDLPAYEKNYRVSLIVMNYSLSLDPASKDDFDTRLSNAMNDFQNSLAKQAEMTVVDKIAVNQGDINFDSSGQVPGHLLNQFSMDEYNGNLRVATTTGETYQGNSQNNLYILDDKLNIVGKVEDLASGERIYSARFLGDRAYLVTFKNVDPLFVIDVKNPDSPKVLGYLKIPGYSDYLHPYDENHVIGIGKDANESIDADKIHSAGSVYYTAILGLKVSLFDVSDVSHPVEVSKIILGERGSDSPALYDHKAFLFDKDKGIIVLPVTLTKVRNQTNPWGSYETYDTVFQGAVVLNINSTDLSIRGNITHNNQTSSEKLKPAKEEAVGATRKDVNGIEFTKFNILNGIGQWRTAAAGYESVVYTDYDVDGFPGGVNYVYYPDYNNQIQRSLFMDDTLYTVSNNKIKANDLNTIDDIKSIDLGYTNSYGGIVYAKDSGAVPTGAVQ